MANFKIVQKKNHNAIYAYGFGTIERAEAWLTRYDPRNWTDKTVMREDLEILPDDRNL